MLSAVATHLEEYKVVDGPMADCFCELAIIADFDQRKLSWAHDDPSDMFKRTVPGWRVEQLSCYCAIVFELTKAGLWKWDAAKRSACSLLEEDDQIDAVDALQREANAIVEDVRKHYDPTYNRQTYTLRNRS